MVVVGSQWGRGRVDQSGVAGRDGVGGFDHTASHRRLITIVLVSDQFQSMLLLHSLPSAHAWALWHPLGRGHSHTGTGTGSAPYALGLPLYNRASCLAHWNGCEPPLSLS